MKFYYYPKCSTCQKAKKWLESQQLDFEAIDITQVRPTKEEFLTLFEKSGYESKKFFNTSGILYREGNYKEKLAKLSDSERADILASEGMLVKRPLLIKNDKVLLGFKEENYLSLLD